MKAFVLLDRSGSMTSLWTEAVGSVNAYVKGLKPKTEVYFAVFDSSSYDVIRESTVKDWNDVTIDEIRPRGMTPLYDSFGKLASKVTEDGVKKSVVVVMTDGYENASKEYTLDAVKSTIKSFEERNWPVMFLGANFDDVTKVGNTLGTDYGSTYSMSPENMVAGMRGLSVGTMSYASTGNRDDLRIDEKTRKKLAS